MGQLCIIGDTHGLIPQYLEICRRADDKCLHTIQLGDMGWKSHYEQFVGKLDSTKHKFFKGNHDDYTTKIALDYDLGDFGTYEVPGFGPIFFVRGAFSVDKNWRIANYFKTGFKSWWEEEELTEEQGFACLQAYKKAKPQVLITHDIPRVVANKVGNPELLKNWGFNPATFTTRTSELLQKLVEVHAPRIVVAGHFHRSYTVKIGETTFVGLAELETFTLDTKVWSLKQYSEAKAPIQRKNRSTK